MMGHSPEQDPLEIAELEMGGQKPNPRAFEQTEDEINPPPSDETDPRVAQTDEELNQLP